MKRNRYKIKARALEVPKIAQYILLIDHCVSVFFSQCKKIIPLVTDKGELRNKLFYIEKSLKQHLGNLPASMSEKMKRIILNVRN